VVQSAGNLIDFDMASYWDTKGSGAWSRTGTAPYMALAVMSDVSEPPLHLPWHDIESVFWVLFLGEGRRAGHDSFKAPNGTDLESLKHSKSYLVSFGWVTLKKAEFMQGHVGLLLRRLRGFLFDPNWTQTAEMNDVIALDDSYRAERFQVSVQDDRKTLGKNIANALEKAVKIIDTWFEECIDGLQKD
jgi:hypothetical protein